MTLRIFIILQFTFLFYLIVSGIAQAQTVVKGKVTDELTNEPIPFVTVIFKGTTIGMNKIGRAHV